ncbi:hypothetical protein CBM2589_B300060 [Cupriavidus taiwanensis]|uniref:Uncharacterized protein n=1 Tax=Cupriavidus taiwanensis TaxID=164546 RepID=A0A375BVU6_9BURK|nr:hypothetical protein CBM2589_B300060 [Cupriavidus taiwanensis]
MCQLVRAPTEACAGQQYCCETFANPAPACHHLSPRGAHPAPGAAGNCCAAKNRGVRQWYPCPLRCRRRLSVEPCSRHAAASGQSPAGTCRPPCAGEAPL